MSFIDSGADRKNYFRALLTNTAYYYPCDKSLSGEFKALHEAVSNPYASALDKARFKCNQQYMFSIIFGIQIL